MVPALLVRAAAGARRHAATVTYASTVAVGIWFALMLVRPVGPPVLGWLPSLLAAALAATACWSLARRVAPLRALAQFWRRIATSVALVGCGALLRAVHGLDPTADARRVGLPAMIVFLISLVVAGLALFRLPLGLAGGRRVWRFWLDIGTVMLAAAVFFWYFTARAAQAVERENGDALVTGMIASSLALVLVFAVVKVMLTGSSTIDPGALRALGMAMAVGALGSSVESLLPTYLSTGQVIVPLCCALAVLAAGRQGRATAAPTTTTAAGRRRSFSLLPYAAVAASMALLVYTAAAAARADRLIVAGAVACLVALVILRQFLAFLDNDRLVGQLDARMAELRASERRFRSLVQNSSDLTTVTGPDGRFTYLSPGANRVLGIEPADWVGRSGLDLVHPDDVATALARYEEIRQTPGATATFEARLAHGDGSWRWVEMTQANLRHDPAIGGIVGNARDVTETRAVEQVLRHQAHHDPLTGLANRTLFQQRVEQALAAGGPLGVLLVDLNDFKAVNDTLGHAAGDELLKVVTRRLCAHVRRTDVVARLGGDEFAVLCLDLPTEQLGTVTRTVQQVFAEPVDVAGYRARVSASIGVAGAEPGTTADELLRRADVAMYAAKADRDGADSRYACYTPALDAPMMDRVSLAAELRAAIDGGELRLLYQPVMAVGGSRVAAVEALIRWAHPVRGLLSPVHFVPLAESSDLIIGMGRWVLDEACAQASRWYREHGDAAPLISVNVSARQLHDPALPDDVRAALTRAGLPAHRLTIEITETAAVHPQSIEVLRELHRCGVRVSLDDFGTGNSSLSLLQSCPVDEVKLDRSFARTAVGAGQRSVARAVIEIARALELDVVAEGVETAEQAACLADLGYRHLQGFHFARPGWPAQVEELLARGGSRTAAPAA